MHKILNDRPLFYCFLAFGFGILLARPIFCLDILTCMLVSLGFALVIGLCIKYKKFVSIALIVICFLLGVLGFYFSEKSFVSKNYGNESVLITGRVMAETVHDKNQTLILDNVFINGNKTGECLSVNIFECTEMEEGVVITFESVLNNTTLFTLKKFNSYYYKYNVRYTTVVNLEDVEINNTNVLNWSEKLKLAIKVKMFKNMSNNEAAIAYASLFGDKTYISSDIKEDFSVSGMAHMLAVSGLHVGFLVTILTGLLRRVKLKKYLKFVIVASILFMYCYLCGFSASVVRASIMFAILSFSGLVGKKYDKLNAWGFAGIICLLIKPLSVYDGGFLLSFMCVLCIFMFAKPLEQKLISWHFPKYLASSLGILIPVQFGLLPLMSVYYTKMSLLSIVANFIAVPLFEIFFVILFLFTIITLILPFMQFILYLPKIIISIIISCAQIISSLNFAVINMTFVSGILVLMFYFCMFLFSHFVNLRIKLKTIALLGICALGLICTIVTRYPQNAENFRVTVLNTYAPTYVLEINNKSFAIGEFNPSNINLTKNYLIESRLYVADYFISLNESLPKDKSYYKNVYSCKINNEQYLLENEFKVNENIIVKPIIIGKTFAGVIIECNNIKFMFCTKTSLSNVQLAEFGLYFPEIDYIFGETEIVENINQYLECKNTIKDGKKLNNEISFTGNWTFNLKQCNITMRGAD